MPRAPRKASSSGYYHITQRGNAQSIIFEDDHCRRQFLRILKKYRDELGFRVLAWCLMDDHFHLALDVGDKDLSSIMRHIEGAYVAFFNAYESRTGHVFQGPFRSVPIETNEQLLATVLYIHNNPEKAGICPAQDYRWSSIQEYAGTHYVVAVETILGMVGSIEALLQYEADPKEIAYTSHKAHFTDAEAMTRAKQLLGKHPRNTAIAYMHDEGYAKPQIARVFGIGTRTVNRAIRSVQG